MAVDQAAVALAVHEIIAHPAVIDVQGPFYPDGGARLDITLDLGFGARWVAEGESPKGVRPHEVVRIDFAPSFPLSAPLPSLRPDFSRNHPHVQPTRTSGGRPIPCLVDGSLNEFFAANGAWRIIDQLLIWLRKAAEGCLIDPVQGWEPMRRDALKDYLILDPDHLRRLVTPVGGRKLFDMSYGWRRPAKAQHDLFIGQFRREISEKAAREASRIAERKGDLHAGTGLGFLIWAGRDPAGGGPAICKHYEPDGVEDVQSLLALAQRLNLRDGLAAALATIGRFDFDKGETIPAPIVLAVRRPYPLVGGESEIELIPYLIHAKKVGLGVGNARVTPLAAYGEITPDLLGRLSDAPAGATWALLGCGSLGSKIALHRARDGRAPVICGDLASMKPHNAARHALTPDPNSKLGWLGGKADLLAETIAGFGQPIMSVYGDHQDLLAGLDKVPAAIWLVNSTASTIVREDLAGSASEAQPRIIEAGLFDHGALGYFATEGLGHNPDSVELMGELYALARGDADVGHHLFPADGQLATISVGQGCGSLTMRVSDAKLSMMAATMSQLLAEADPAVAEGRIDLLLREGLGVQHRHVAAPAWLRMPLEGLEGWSLSISPRAVAAIEAEVKRYAKVETGGVLIGFHSLIAKRIYVTDVHPAPPDSTRSRAEFVLGVRGLTEARVDLAERTRGALSFAGTWHSHLGAATPSGKDRRSAAVVGENELQPKAFLIRGVGCMRAISAAAVAATNSKETV